MPAVAKTQPQSQIAFRVPQDMRDRLDALATRFGLDTSGFLRLILSEQLAGYERRAAKMERGEEEED
jgi:predicted DNA-binding protein